MKFKDLYEKLFFQTLRIRLVEERIIEIYPTDKIQSPVHLSIGQEAVATAVCNHLQIDDLLYSSYRSHAYYLAKGGDLKKMFSELYGKHTGSGKGKAGSMHLADKAVGMMGSSAIVGSTISHGVGSALASKLLNKNQVIVTTFGDGATEEGSYHESLNFASVFQVPVIFVCENNGLAIHSKLENRHSYKIHEHAATYNIPSLFIEEGYDFLSLSNVIGGIVSKVRASQTPYFIEIKTYRYKEHVGIGDDHNVPYRSKSEYEKWRSLDPLISDEARTAQFSDLIMKEIDEAVSYAETSAYPPHSELLKDVY